MKSMLVSAVKTLFVLVMMLVAFPAGCPKDAPLPHITNWVIFQKGKASFYADAHHGRRTASGETFDMNDLTAAHPRLPFGTLVRVVNKWNGKSVVVRINDRGPFVTGRVIDLSRRAAYLIGVSGIAQVALQVEKR